LKTTSGRFSSEYSPAAADPAKAMTKRISSALMSATDHARGAASRRLFTLWTAAAKGKFRGLGPLC
jgi:hypothetical protein